MRSENAEQSPPGRTVPRVLWRGLGFWNFYFFSKLLLYWGGYINLHVFYNLLFAAALLIPLPPVWLHRLRHLIAVPVGVALFYYDTWLPPFRRLLEQPEVLQFSNDYLLELASRFINWELVGAGFIALVVFLFLSQWLRMSMFTMLALFGLALTQWSAHWLPQVEWTFSHAQVVEPAAQVNHDAEPKRAVAPAQSRSLNEVLGEALEDFYIAEQGRHVSFPTQGGQAPDFDLLFLNICSLSWDDLDATGLSGHPLFDLLDVVFTEFNSATSYSGPAVQRLLQANCGQQSHRSLYEEQNPQCSLFGNLQQLGFKTQAALNHDAQFQNLIDDIMGEPAFGGAFIPTGQRAVLRGFDNSPIWADYETLNAWWKSRNEDNNSAAAALFYNSITLHDGNREPTADGGGRSSPFERRMGTVLDDLERFLLDLQQEDRKIMVVLVPEHGAAFRGDRMQISGLREIPTAEITLVPVGVSFIGAKARPEQPVQITQPSSFLALAELVSRVLADGTFFDKEVDWDALLDDLPTTRLVAENEGVVSFWHEGKPYVRFEGRDWIEYRP